MAIINPRRPSTASAGTPASRHAGSRGLTTWLLALGGLGIGGTLALGLPGVPTWSLAPLAMVAAPFVASDEKLESAGMLDEALVDRAVRLAHVAVLARQELEVNEISLTEAQGLGADTTTHALELVVAKHRSELARARERIAHAINDLRVAVASNPDDATVAFGEALAAEGLRAEPEVSGLLQTVVRLCVEPPPRDTAEFDWLLREIEGVLPG